MKAIQARFGDDKQGANAEIQALYKDLGIKSVPCRRTLSLETGAPEAQAPPLEAHSTPLLPTGAPEAQAPP